MNLKFDQLAIATKTGRVQDDLTKNGTWSEDCVTTRGRNAAGVNITNMARLRFNYERWPMEFEVLHYTAGWHWHMLFAHAGLSWLSHYGMHCDDEATVSWAKGRWAVLQESVTVEHSNPAVPPNRRYRYVIFDARADLGAELKLIQRLTVDQSRALLRTMGIDP